MMPRELLGATRVEVGHHAGSPASSTGPITQAEAEQEFLRLFSHGDRQVDRLRQRQPWGLHEKPFALDVVPVRVPGGPLNGSAGNASWTFARAQELSRHATTGPRAGACAA